MPVPGSTWPCCSTSRSMRLRVAGLAASGLIGRMRGMAPPQKIREEWGGVRHHPIRLVRSGKPILSPEAGIGAPGVACPPAAARIQKDLAPRVRFRVHDRWDLGRLRGEGNRAHGRAMRMVVAALEVHPRQTDVHELPYGLANRVGPAIALLAVGVYGH